MSGRAAVINRVCPFVRFARHVWVLTHDVESINFCIHIFRATSQIVLTSGTLNEVMGMNKARGDSISVSPLFQKYCCFTSYCPNNVVEPNTHMVPFSIDIVKYVPIWHLASDSRLPDCARAWWDVALMQTTRARFDLKMSFCQYRKSHCGDKTIVRSSYLHNGISYICKMASLYWFSPHGPIKQST